MKQDMAEQYMPEHWPENQTRITRGVVINPNLRPGFLRTPTKDLSALEKKHWIGQPFILIVGKGAARQYEVYCLGLEPDNLPKCWGSKQTLDSAISYLLRQVQDSMT